FPPPNSAVHQPSKTRTLRVCDRTSSGGVGLMPAKTNTATAKTSGATKLAERPASWGACTQRFGETVRDAGVPAVPRVLLTGMASLKIKPIHLAVLLQLIASWGNAGPHPFPSRARMRRQIGCDKRTLDRAIAQLAEQGLIENRKRPGKLGGWWTNEYD